MPRTRNPPGAAAAPPIPTQCGLCNRFFCTPSRDSCRGVLAAAAANGAPPVQGICRALSISSRINSIFHSPGHGFANAPSIRKLSSLTFPASMEIPEKTFGGNLFEANILKDHLAQTNRDVDYAYHKVGRDLVDNDDKLKVKVRYFTAAPRSVPRECEVLLSPDDLANKFACYACAHDVLAASLYRYRSSVTDSSELPDRATTEADGSHRQKCWYGAECRTQFHNPAHAEHRDHVGDNVSAAGRRGKGKGGRGGGG